MLERYAVRFLGSRQHSVLTGLAVVSWVAVSGCSGGVDPALALGGAADDGGSSSTGDAFAGSGIILDGDAEAPKPSDRTPVERFGDLSTDGPFLVDEDGEPVQLKGPSSMWLNWEDTGFAVDPDGMQFLRDDWGATVVRAAMGVEPQGAYLNNRDATLDEVRDVIDTAIMLGMYVIVDWHDHRAEEHQEEAVEFFRQIATEYGDTPNIIYETYNEPLMVEWLETLRPYHQAVVDAIREVDPDNIIILGTPSWSQQINVAAAAPVDGNNLMYTLHFYSCSHAQWLRTTGDQAIAGGVPIFVTEWGATHADGGTPNNPDLCINEAQRWHDWMDEHMISWAAWKLDDCQDQSCYFQPNTAPEGDWSDSQLQGHAEFVRARMRF